jgi:CHAT domain-containing protein
MNIAAAPYLAQRNVGRLSHAHPQPWHSPYLPTKKVGRYGAPTVYRPAQSFGFCMWLSGLALVLFSTGAATAQQTPLLKPNVSVERALSGGQTHEYRVALEAGQFFDAVVEQEGIDVEVALLGPDGRPIGHMDSLNNDQGPEPMAAIAGASGEYRLQIIASNPKVAPGAYKVTVLALRPATAEDAQHVAADRAVDEANNLLSEGKAASLAAAADKFQGAAVIYHSSGLRYDEALALYGIGVVRGQSGDFKGALLVDEQARLLFHALQAHGMEGSTINNMGGAYDVLGDLPRALTAYQAALPLLRSSGARTSEASALNNIGKIHADMAEWEEAGEYYQQALPIFRAAADKERESITLRNLGRINFTLGQNDRAMEYYKQALALDEAEGNQREESATLVGMAATYQSQDQTAQALQLYQKALALDRATGDHWHQGLTLRDLASANLAAGEPQTSLQELQEALTLLRAAGDRRAEGLALGILGRVYAALEQPQQALTACRQALAILESVGDRSHAAQDLQQMAQLERDQGQLGDARQHAEEALALVEKVRATAGAQEDRASYFATQQSLGEFYIDLLMRLHQQDEAFEAAERQRARSLLEMLAEARVDFRQGVDPRLLERQREISGLLNSKAERLLTLRGDGAQERATALKQEIRELEGESEQVELAIRKSSPRYSAITQPQPLTLKQIEQQVLDPDTVLLEYALGELHSYLWTVTTTGVKSYELPPRSEIEKSVREVTGLLMARGTYVKGESAEQTKARIAAADTQLPQASTKLSNMVLGPAAGELRGRRLVLVTDGSLQHVPFAMLPAPGVAAAGTLLVEEHEIVSLPSASTVSELRQQIAGRRPAPELIAVLADPVFQADDPRVHGHHAVATAIDTQVDSSRILVHGAGENAEETLRVPRLPFTRQEADRIIKLAGTKDSLEALDFQASLATATGPDLGRYRYLHFATHGYLDSEQPDLSAIVLALVDKSGRPQPGFLRVSGIYNLKLPADLVVLSACETGLGKEIRGEGIVGLTRGFMYAGAPRVMVSLWSVNDRATEELMAVFYQKLLQQKLAPAAALRLAQAAMAKNKQWSAPYYWAAFVQQGEWK